MKGRERKHKGRIVINQELCKGCELCVVACPTGLIDLSNRINKKGYYPAILTNQEECTACACCARMCPEAIIEVYKDYSV